MNPKKSPSHWHFEVEGTENISGPERSGAAACRGYVHPLLSFQICRGEWHMTRTTTGENTILNQQPRTPTAQPASCPPTAVQLRDHPWVARSVGFPLSFSSLGGKKKGQLKTPQHRSWRWRPPFPIRKPLDALGCAEGAGRNSVLSLIKLGAPLKLLKNPFPKQLMSGIRGTN